MARDRGRTARNGTPERDKYRDSDDVRRPLEGNARTAGSAGTKSEARGKARENVGNTARGTAAKPTGPRGNDKTRSRNR
jgi:hypothetical protein